MPIYISKGTITEIVHEQETTLITVKYTEHTGNSKTEQIVRLVLTPNTVILDKNCVPSSIMKLQTGMVINASFSPAMTRSIPPQAVAFEIFIL